MRGLTEISITVNAGGADHWKAIKNQELFAATVMPHFQAPARQAVARRLVSSERVCVVGAGVIGSLYAAHLAQRRRCLGAHAPARARATRSRRRACG